MSWRPGQTSTPTEITSSTLRSPSSPVSARARAILILRLFVDYVPEARVVELKSLKLYINQYRDRGISHESAANTILDDLVRLLEPRWMRVVAEFNVRGNIKTTIFAEHVTPTYTGPCPEYRRPTHTGI